MSHTLTARRARPYKDHFVASAAWLHHFVRSGRVASGAKLLDRCFPRAQIEVSSSAVEITRNIRFVIRP